MKYSEIKKDKHLYKRVKDTLVIQQGGVCPLCHHPGKFVLDHDHDTDEVRGALCDPCNKILQERVTFVWLNNAIAYLGGLPC